ncbi:MAG: recombinase RecA [Calditrichaeota bacterium]|nr:MAG: recombinase RecA [Calditrichota bacterium]
MAKAKKESKLAKDPRKEALSNAVSEIEKSFGKGAIMKLGGGVKLNVPVISTGSISVDKALGTGGVPRGRIVEIYGPESSGKTTLTLHVIAQAQKAGGLAAFIDVEHALDAEYAKNLGVDLDELLVSQPDDGEQALAIVETLVRSGAVDLIVVDSVAALVPRAEVAGDMGDSHVGLQARLMSHGLRKITGIISKTNTCVLFVNQIREKIGVMYGSPETTPGGRALKFHASVRIEIRRIGSIKNGADIIGNRTKVKIKKNKLAPPFKEAEVDIRFGVGISFTSELIDLAVEEDVLKKSGSWYSYNDERVGQGKEKTMAYLLENEDLFEEIKLKTKASLGILDEKALEALKSSTKKEEAKQDETPSEEDLISSFNELDDDELTKF